MISSFDHVKLEAMLRDFYALTHIRITIYDDACREITAYPRQVDPICRFIRECPEADAACRACDAEACHQAQKRRSTWVYRCHAGLTEAISPIILEGTVVAYLCFGHLFGYEDRREGREAILAGCAAFPLDRSTLQAHIDRMPVTKKTYILSAAHIMEAVASYLCLERTITLRKQTLQVQIDEWISSHFAEDISVDALCRHFGIGRTALYEFARQNYGTGISRHIRDLRMQHARALLINRPDMSIAQVAEACGYGDYNYFIAVFSRTVGLSPRRYRLGAERPEA
ncbi:MAG: PocR ligand-binding domain-containing protein [Clostridia bacterium]|nr:PocR ligand-binding domain-containing protein [Clostridia bacterium]